MPDMPIKPDDEKALTVQFRAALNKRAEGQPRGWAAKLARDADLPIATLSHIMTGRRMATMLQMVRISQALKAPELLPAGMEADTQQRLMVQRGSSDRGSTVSPTPIPASLRSYLDAHPELHPAVRWELEQNHDQRTLDYVVKDDAFWDTMAQFWAHVLGLPEAAVGRGEEGNDPSRRRGR